MLKRNALVWLSCLLTGPLMCKLTLSQASGSTLCSQHHFTSCRFSIFWQWYFPSEINRISKSLTWMHLAHVYHRSSDGGMETPKSRRHLHGLSGHRESEELEDRRDKIRTLGTVIHTQGEVQEVSEYDVGGRIWSLEKSQKEACFQVLSNTWVNWGLVILPRKGVKVTHETSGSFRGVEVISTTSKG